MIEIKYFLRMFLASIVMLFVIIQVSRLIPLEFEPYLVAVIMANIVTFSAVKVGADKFVRDMKRIPSNSEIFRFILIAWAMMLFIACIWLISIYLSKGESFLEAFSHIRLKLEFQVIAPGIVISSIAPWAYLHFFLKNKLKNGS